MLSTNELNMCRICLGNNCSKDAATLRYDERYSYAEVIMFCLKVQICTDSKITTQLCMKCYRKINTFYKFKQLAQTSDRYLKDLQEQKMLKVEEIKTENDAEGIVEHAVVKLEFSDSDNLKEEDLQDMDSNALDSDDECLMAIKQQKLANENEQDMKDSGEVKTNRGRRTKPKLLNKEENIQVCHECGESVKNLYQHSRKHLAESQVFPCELCPKVFNHYNSRKKHIRRKHLGIKRECDICHKKVVDLSSHKLLMHNREALKFACTICDHRVRSQLDLETHLRVHTKERPYECNLCDGKYKTTAQLALHKRQVHDKEKSHLCQYCSKGFFKKYHLQEHLRSHTKETPYECPECGKRYRNMQTLGRHQLTHRGVKQHHCTLCPMSFYVSGALTTHMISHTKSRKHKCNYCEMSFGRSDHRRRHERTAHLHHLATEPRDS
ncbi:zinc finger protein 501 [Plutella xylostella]|uniref:zinc finger protein 501 n=1 Tax=Plutella xylostella TaxID=51655 RepID=UPI0020321AAA|nr:zinc finger protein 501 [Plutella xylostella]